MAGDKAVTLVSLYNRVKAFLGGIKGVDPKTIRADHSLIDDLGFTAAGVRALASRVNKEFVDLQVEVTPDDTGGCETVRDLTVLIFEQIPTT